MNLFNLAIWLIIISVMAGIGIGSMIWAYSGSGSVSVIFNEPITIKSEGIDPEAIEQYQQGCIAYRSRKYRRAIEQFKESIKINIDFAEAYHNLGLSFANLRQDDNAVENLLQAGKLYAKQDRQTALETIEQNLKALKARKEGKKIASAK